MLTRTLSSLPHSSKALQTSARKIASVLTMLAMVFGSFAPLVAFPAAAAAYVTGVPIPVCNPTNTFDTFSSGSVDGQGGWAGDATPINPSFDQAIVPNIYNYPTFGCKTLRISNAVTSGSFGDWIFSPSVANEAGELSAVNSGMSGGTRQNHYEAQFDLGVASTSYQPGAMLSVSPDRGDGARMSYLRFEDHADGVHVFFDDYSESIHDFVETDIATLDRSLPHTIKFAMDFVNGPSNDVVSISIDGSIVHTGTSWEDYFRDNQAAIAPPTVDSLLFREGGSVTAAPATLGSGFLIDNVSVTTSTVPGSIKIVNYVCPVGTTVTRSANGVGLTVPAGCTPGAGTHFGYVHGSQSDALGPYPELGGTFIDGGATTINGVLHIPSLASDGRYLVAATDASSHQLPANAVLGLYCIGDGDTSNNNDNQELTFVPANGVAHCVAYEQVAPDTTPPSVPTLISPANNSFEQTNEFDFTWNASTDDQPGAITYEFQSTQNPAQAGGVLTTGLWSSGTLTSPMIHSSGAGDGTWYWQVRAKDAAGNYSAWSQIWTVTLDTSAPAAPTLLTPADGVTLTTTTWTSADWTDVSDPSSPVTYIYESSNSSATNPDGSFVSPVYTSVPLATSMIPTTGTPAGTYYWHARAIDGAGNAGPWATAFKAIVDNTPVGPSCNASATHVYSSDSDTTFATTTGQASAFVITPHPSWALIDGVSWIWNALINGGTDDSPVGSVTFTKTFPIVGAPTGATLSISADDEYAVSVNGNDISSIPGCKSPSDITWNAIHSCVIPATDLVTGTNTLTVIATNLAVTDPNYTGPNPAGLTYSLSVGANECITPAVKVHVMKYMRNGSTIAQVPDAATYDPFPMTATWDASIGAGTAPYILGNNWGGAAFRYAADTSPMNAPVNSYNTVERTSDIDGTSNVLPIGSSCAANKFRLVGYKSGNSLATAEAAAISPTAPTFIDFSADKYVIVVNEDCNTTIKVHVFKYLDNSDGGVAQVPNDSDAPAFPMIATYAIAGVATNLNPGDGYVLGNFGGIGGSDGGLKYAANTIKLSAGDEYGTHEVTGGDSVVVADAAQCSAGKYYLRGYKTGDSLAVAEGSAISTTAPDFQNITADKYVIVINEKCSTPPDEPESAALTIVKHTIGGDGTFNFTISGIEGTKTLSTEGGWATSTTIIIGTASTTISELATSGWSYGGASCVYENQDVGFTPVAGTKIVKVDNGDQVTCTFTNTKDAVPTPTFSYSTTTVKAADLATSVSDAIANPAKWFFVNDQAAGFALDNTQGTFVNGPLTAPLQNGSAQITATTTQGIILDTFAFKGTRLDKITNLGYSTYRSAGDTPLALALQFDIDKDVTDAITSYQGRLVYEPYYTHTVTTGAWQAWNPMDNATLGGHGNWWFSNGTLATASGCTQASPCTWTQVLAAFPNAGISGSTDFKAGSNWSSTFTGNIDNFVIGVQTGLNTDTKTFDFEPTAAVTPTVVNESTPSGSTGGSGGGGNGPIGRFAFSAPTLPTPPGIVKGASTSTIQYGAECERYITDFIKPGAQNDPTQVARLQYVLAVLEGLDVPQNGVYDSVTIAGVKAFQTKYASDILTPWGMSQSTGFVYLTTKKKLDEIYCKNGQTFPLTPAEQAIIDAYRNRKTQSSTGASTHGNVTAPKDTNTPPDTTVGQGDDNSSQTAAAAASQGTTTRNWWDTFKSFFGK
jgi:hypothetical protein